MPHLKALSEAADLISVSYTHLDVYKRQVYSVIENEFGVPVRHLYKTFDEKPLAAASLSQAHRATLHDGTPVIVKVQRPNIREQVETDIEILYRRARFLESHWERARTYGITCLLYTSSLRSTISQTGEE